MVVLDNLWPMQDYNMKIEELKNLIRESIEELNAENNPQSNDVSKDRTDYRNLWHRLEELSVFIGRSLLPQKSVDEQLRIGKNVIEGLSKNNPIGKNAIDWVVQRGYLKPERRDEFVKRCVEIYNALKRGNQMK